MADAPVTREIERPPGPWMRGPVAGRFEHVKAPWEYFQELQREYGDLVYFKLGLRDAYLVNDPELIKDILVTNDRKFRRGGGINRGYAKVLGEGVLMTAEGERYRRERRLVLPSLDHKRLATYASIMTDRAIALASTFVDGEPRDIYADSLQLALGVVLASLFGADLPEDRVREVSGHVSEFMNVFNRRTARNAAIEAEHTQDAIAKAKAVVLELIRERRGDPTDHGDLLSMLLQARDEEGDGTGLTDEDVQGEILSLIVAGHETVSSGMTWTWYLLSQNPEAEARLHAELDEVLAGRAPTAEDLMTNRLPYLKKVISESLRLFPPGSLGVDRVVLEDHELAGYPIPAGSTIVMSMYVVQRDPRWFPDPERFDPERWTPEEEAGRPQFSYFPFSGGLRTCVGWGFAVMEISLVIATIAARWQLELDLDRPLEIDARIAIKPAGGLRVVPHRRSEEADRDRHP